MFCEADREELIADAEIRIEFNGLGRKLQSVLELAVAGRLLRERRSTITTSSEVVDRFVPGNSRVESEVSSPNAFRIVVATVAAAWMTWSLVAARRLRSRCGCRSRFGLRWPDRM
jgi:hypothetical protein